MNAQESQYGIPDDATLAVMQKRSFSDQVAMRLQERQPSLGIEYYGSVPEAYEQGMPKDQYVLLPFENSGSDPSVVWRHIDLIDNDPTAVITYVVDHNVLICAGALAGMTAEQVTTVRTHPKAMDQTSRYLSQFSNVKRIEENSTAAGLQNIATGREWGSIGLGTREAIEAVGLMVLDDSPNITNLPANQNITQFFVVHKNGGSIEPQYDMKHHAALLRMPKGGPGTLVKALNVMKAGGVNLTSLHSRTEDPNADMTSARYEFFIEMERAGEPQALRTMQTGLHQLNYGDMRWLGSWNDTMPAQLSMPDLKRSDELHKLEIDFSRRYHRLLLEPKNRPGVLCDILTVIANSRVDIPHLQSRNVGPKQYLFDVILDQSTANSSADVQYMADALYHSGFLLEARTAGNSDLVDELRQIQLSV